MEQLVRQVRQEQQAPLVQEQVTALQALQVQLVLREPQVLLELLEILDLVVRLAQQD
jgi:hypothetical protein